METNTNQELIVAERPGELYRRSTDVAGLCRDIVVKTAVTIQGKKYVKAEGWLAIATAHGCIVSSRDVERVEGPEGGYRATGEVRKISDGTLIATAEGFVGQDEPTWFGGEIKVAGGTKRVPKRSDYAIRAMAQTRAISRVCRAAFAHCVVLMDAGLQTTPAEEMPRDGAIDIDSSPANPMHPEPAKPKPAPEKPAPKQKPVAADPAAPLPAGHSQADCILVDVKEAFSKEGAPRPWHAFFCTFKDMGGNLLEAGTFDTKIGEQLPHLLNTTVNLVFKPSSKQGKFEIVSLEQHDIIP